jgi:hypothetical protein
VVKGGSRRSKREGGGGKGGEMTQTLYAHMNKIKIKINLKKFMCTCIYLFVVLGYEFRPHNLFDKYSAS